MKTPDEIKKGLECCLKVGACNDECPYYNDGCGDDQELKDAIAYIQQLEGELNAIVIDHPYESGFMAGFKAAHPKWISVEERLPDNFEERVLVCIEDGNCIIGNPSEDTDRFDPIRKRWVRYGDMVTRWMPLPEPPKEET